MRSIRLFQPERHQIYRYRVNAENDPEPHRHNLRSRTTQLEKHYAYGITWTSCIIQIVNNFNSMLIKLNSLRYYSRMFKFFLYLSLSYITTVDFLVFNFKIKLISDLLLKFMGFQFVFQHLIVLGSLVDYHRLLTITVT